MLSKKSERVCSPDTDWQRPGVSPAYPSHGGILREEAIMLLRGFYVQVNEKGKHASMNVVMNLTKNSSGTAY